MIRIRFVLMMVIVAGVMLSIRTALAASPGTRSADPVVVSAENLPDFLTKPITDVVLYAYANGSWQPIPFQIDERMIEPDDTALDYVAFEDGLIDADDELVFMAMDAGSAEMSWPVDPNASQNPRARIELSDPLNQATGVVYLFDSTTLTRSTTSYVSLDLASETVSAVSYTLGFNSSTFIGLDSLTLNGQPTDLVDRQKIRVEAGVPPFFVTTLNEEELSNQLGASPFASIVTGSVRLVEGGDFATAFYASRFDIAFNLDIDAVNAALPAGSVQSVRVSLDHNMPTTTGVASYADSNGAVAAIDGSADASVTSALRDWYQVSGGVLGGLAVTIPELTVAGGQLTSYYADDAAPADDTGDGQQFADTGIVITGPSGQLVYEQVNYVLPPNTTASVGAGYYQQATMPISVVISAETTTPTTVALSNSAASATYWTIAMVLGAIACLLPVTNRAIKGKRGASHN